MLWLFIFSLYVLLLASNQCACFMFTFPVVLGENNVTVIFFFLQMNSFRWSLLFFNSQVTIWRVTMWRVVLQSANGNISNDTRMSVEWRWKRSLLQTSQWQQMFTCPIPKKKARTEFMSLKKQTVWCWRLWKWGRRYGFLTVYHYFLRNCLQLPLKLTNQNLNLLR